MPTEQAQKNRLEYLYSRYQQNPALFTDDQLDLLQRDADRLGIEWERIPDYNEFRLLETVKQTMYGYVHGFTTFAVGDVPQTEIEAIARSVGHLAGFVGYVPASLFKAPMIAAAAAAGTRSGAVATKAAPYLKGLAEQKVKYGLMSIPSAPMLAASWAEKGVKWVGGKTVYQEGGRLMKMLDDTPIAKEVMRGAFHLGTASAVSSWQEGADAMMHSAAYGAIAGAFFRTLGEWEGVKHMASTDGGQQAIRAIAGAAWTGLPSTLRGDTTPTQVYEYLLGAWFGFHEKPYARRVAEANLDKMQPAMLLDFAHNPERIWGAEWGKLKPGVREYMQELASERAPEQLAVLYEKGGEQVRDRITRGAAIIAKMQPGAGEFRADEAGVKVEPLADSDYAVSLKFMADVLRREDTATAEQMLKIGGYRSIEPAGSKTPFNWKPANPEELETPYTDEVNTSITERDGAHLKKNAESADVSIFFVRDKEKEPQRPTDRYLRTAKNAAKVQATIVVENPELDISKNVTKEPVKRIKKTIGKFQFDMRRDPETIFITGEQEVPAELVESIVKEVFDPAAREGDKGHQNYGLKMLYSGGAPGPEQGALRAVAGINYELSPSATEGPSILERTLDFQMHERGKVTERGERSAFDVLEADYPGIAERTERAIGEHGNKADRVVGDELDMSPENRRTMRSLVKERVDGVRTPRYAFDATTGAPMAAEVGRSAYAVPHPLTQRRAKFSREGRLSLVGREDPDAVIMVDEVVRRGRRHRLTDVELSDAEWSRLFKNMDEKGYYPFSFDPVTGDIAFARYQVDLSGAEVAMKGLLPLIPAEPRKQYDRLYRSTPEPERAQLARDVYSNIMNEAAAYKKSVDNLFPESWLTVPQRMKMHNNLAKGLPLGEDVRVKESWTSAAEVDGGAERVTLRPEVFDSIVEDMGYAPETAALRLQVGESEVTAFKGTPEQTTDIIWNGTKPGTMIEDISVNNVRVLDRADVPVQDAVAPERFESLLASDAVPKTQIRRYFQQTRSAATQAMKSANTRFRAYMKNPSPEKLEKVDPAEMGASEVAIALSEGNADLFRKVALSVLRHGTEGISQQRRNRLRTMETMIQEVSNPYSVLQSIGFSAEWSNAVRRFLLRPQLTPRIPDSAVAMTRSREGIGKRGIVLSETLKDRFKEGDRVLVVPDEMTSVDQAFPLTVKGFEKLAGAQAVLPPEYGATASRVTIINRLNENFLNSIQDAPPSVSERPYVKSDFKNIGSLSGHSRLARQYTVKHWQRGQAAARQAIRDFEAMSLMSDMIGKREAVSWDHEGVGTLNTRPREANDGYGGIVHSRMLDVIEDQLTRVEKQGEAAYQGERVRFPNMGFKDLKAGLRWLRKGGKQGSVSGRNMLRILKDYYKEGAFEVIRGRGGTSTEGRGGRFAMGMEELGLSADQISDFLSPRSRLMSMLEEAKLPIGRRMISRDDVTQRFAESMFEMDFIPKEGVKGLPAREAMDKIFREATPFAVTERFASAVHGQAVPVEALLDRADILSLAYFNTKSPLPSRLGWLASRVAGLKLKDAPVFRVIPRFYAKYFAEFQKYLADPEQQENLDLLGRPNIPAPSAELINGLSWVERSFLNTETRSQSLRQIMTDDKAYSRFIEASGKEPVQGADARLRQVQSHLYRLNAQLVRELHHITSYEMLMRHVRAAIEGKPETDRAAIVTGIREAMDSWMPKMLREMTQDPAKAGARFSEQWDTHVEAFKELGVEPEAASRLMDVLALNSLRAGDARNVATAAGFRVADPTVLKEFIETYDKHFKMVEDSPTPFRSRPDEILAEKMLELDAMDAIDLFHGFEGDLPPEGVPTEWAAVKLTRDELRLRDELKQEMGELGWKVKSLPGIIRGRFNIDPQYMSTGQAVELLSWMRSMRRPSIFQAIMTGVAGIRGPRFSDWLKFYETVAKEMRTADPQLLPMKVKYWEKRNNEWTVGSGTAYAPSSTMLNLQQAFAYINGFMDADQKEHTYEHEDRFKSFLGLRRVDGTEASGDVVELHDIATRYRQKDDRAPGTPGYQLYTNRWQDVAKIYAKKYRETRYILQRVDPTGKPFEEVVTGRDLVEGSPLIEGDPAAGTLKPRTGILQDLMTKYYARMIFGNNKDTAWVRREQRDGKYPVYDQFIVDPAYPDVLDMHRFYDEVFRPMELGERPQIMVNKGKNRLGVPLFKRVTHLDNESVNLYLYQDQVREAYNIAYGDNRPETLAFIQQQIRPEDPDKPGFQRVGYQNVNKYMTQTGHSKAARDAWFERKVAQTNKKNAKERAAAAIEGRQEMLESVMPDAGQLQAGADYILEVDPITPEKIGIGRRVSSMLHRSEEPIPDWATDIDVHLRYGQTLIRNYYKAAQIAIAKRRIREFIQNDTMGEHTKDWARFMALYARDDLGYPSTIPESYIKSRGLNIKKTPYWWTSDEAAVRFLKKLGVRLGSKDLPKGLSEADLKSLAKRDDLDAMQKIATLSNLEGRWEMATLLFSTKTITANMFGGNANTIINVGWDAWKKANSLKYIQQNIDPSFTTWESVYKWISSHGLIEQFYLYEGAFARRIGPAKAGAFIQETVNAIKANPKLKDAELGRIAQKHGITEQIFEIAGWPMRWSERRLRATSFLAHYFHAKRMFDGLLADRDDPWAVQMALRGVKATQFMYSSPFRPAYSRTSLGRILTRFQQWSWSSHRFRKDIIREASIRGFSPNTEEFQRFRRLISHDVFMMALASLLPMSLFESALPAPLSWAQDTALWLFGDDEERDRAFFGTYPVYLRPMVALPATGAPISRYVLSLAQMKNVEEFSRYQMWTLFPFGRMIRDAAGFQITTDEEGYHLKATGALPWYPEMLADRMTGVPVHRAARGMREWWNSLEEEDEEEQ